MTHKDESAPADADLTVPSTRRGRRDGEREAAHRALYADSAQPSSSMRVVDGGAPMYRTRREMRESASRLARDLPVIVEPVLEADAADVDASSIAASPESTAPAKPGGRRARRAADATPAAAEPVAPTPAPASRRSRRMAVLASSPTAPERTQAVDETPAAEQATAAQPSVDAPRATEAEPVAAESTTAHGSRRARRAATPGVDAPAAWSDLASAPQDDRAQTQVVAPEPVIEAPAAVAAAAPPASEPTASAPTDVRAVTRAERRAAQAASSDEVSAAVAAVLGSEQEDVASTPVRSPLRREARAPKPAVVARRPIAHAPVVRPSRRARSGAARKAMQRLAAAGVILSIGSFVAVTSLPAQAFSPSEPSSTTGAYGDVEVEQQLDVTTGSGAHGDEEVTAVLTRDDFGVDDALATARMGADELASLQSVADSEEIGPYYGGDPAMPAVWAQLETSYTQSPFPSLAEVPVSSGFGYRWGSFHGGVDLIPGAGTPVYPIANGVVVATWQGNNPGGGGYEVIVEHNIDGQYFQSWYPHMQAGSIQVEPGQVVDITTQLGAVGSTGRSTGAHLHLEIKNGDYISVDPLVWLATREQILEP